MRVCDNCKREPTPYRIKGSEELGYFFRVHENGDLVDLMSDLTFAYCSVTDRNPEEDHGYQFWCEACFQQALDEEDERRK